jgi:hypothetical protein
MVGGSRRLAIFPVHPPRPLINHQIYPFLPKLLQKASVLSALFESILPALYPPAGAISGLRPADSFGIINRKIPKGN